MRHWWRRANPRPRPSAACTAPIDNEHRAHPGAHPDAHPDGSDGVDGAGEELAAPHTTDDAGAATSGDDAGVHGQDGHQDDQDDLAGTGEVGDGEPRGDDGEPERVDQHHRGRRDEARRSPLGQPTLEWAADGTVTDIARPRRRTRGRHRAARRSPGLRATHSLTAGLLTSADLSSAASPTPGPPLTSAASPDANAAGAEAGSGAEAGDEDPDPDAAQPDDHSNTYSSTHGDTHGGTHGYERRDDRDGYGDNDRYEYADEYGDDRDPAAARETPTARLATGRVGELEDPWPTDPYLSAGAFRPPPIHPDAHLAEATWPHCQRALRGGGAARARRAPRARGRGPRPWWVTSGAMLVTAASLGVWAFAQLPATAVLPAADTSPYGATGMAPAAFDAARFDPVAFPPVFGALGVPRAALEAYQRAEDRLGQDAPGCQLPWALLAGIGKVESDHAGGGAVTASGQTMAPIHGPVLNGTGGHPARADTDRGALDADPVWDRASGPMQFLPRTWMTYGDDNSGDAVADPHNLADAALGAGRYLCAGDADLADPTELHDAVYRYNHSETYVASVLSWARAYTERTEPRPDATTPPAAIITPQPTTPPAPAPAPALPAPLPAPSTVPPRAELAALPPTTPTAPSPAPASAVPTIPAPTAASATPVLRPDPTRSTTPTTTPAPEPDADSSFGASGAGASGAGAGGAGAGASSGSDGLGGDPGLTDTTPSTSAGNDTGYSSADGAAGGLPGAPSSGTTACVPTPGSAGTGTSSGTEAGGEEGSSGVNAAGALLLDTTRGDLAQWFNNSGNRGLLEDAQRPRVVTNPLDPGREAFAFTVPGGGTRSEVLPRGAQNFVNGDRAFFAYTGHLAPGFPVDTEDWQLIFQFHHEGNTGSPPLALEVKEGQLWLTAGGSGKADQPLGPVAAGEVFNVAMEVGFATGGGDVTVWRDGQQVLERWTPPQGTMLDDRNYLKVGLYRSEDIDTPGTVYLHSLKIGDSLAAVTGCNP